jgi:rRNA maturation RNase YbeY
LPPRRKISAIQLPAAAPPRIAPSRRSLLKLRWPAPPSTRRLPLTKPDRRQLAEILNHFWRECATTPIQLEVNFVEEREIRLLQRNFLQDDSATDVITFDLGAAPDGWRVAAIAVCVPVAKNYAAQYGVSLREELLRLIIHGALHLLGYDDHTAVGRKRMRYAENKILRQM